MKSGSTSDTISFAVAYYASNRKTGALSVVERGKFGVKVMALETAPETGLEAHLKPILIGMTERRQVILLDPQSRKLEFVAAFPIDAFPAHIYSDPGSTRDWFMNDGDKETGNDALNCGDRGSSVTVVDNTARSSAKWLRTICVGRGHHQATFIGPSPAAPHTPRRAYISNLKDGTISVIGNDSTDTATYLQNLATINLCEPDKEEKGVAAAPNNAFPHGIAYSPLTGKLYNLNNGYGTVAVIDPITNEIEERIPFKGHSNLFASPNGRYLIGRGADRKSDPQHAIGKLSVFDVMTRTVVTKLDLPDIYISKYYFNPEGTRLYLTTSSSGSPEQQRNLKADVLLVFDVTALPALTLIKEIKVGSSGSLAFCPADGRASWVLSSDSENGALVVVDGVRNEVVESIPVTAGGSHSRIWLLNSP